MSDLRDISTIFSSFQEYIDKEQDIREDIRTVTRELEQNAREIVTVMQGIHQPDGLKNLSAICCKAESLFEKIKSNFADLATKVPQDQYYRFHDHWRFVMQRLSFLSALICYLQNESLISQQQTASMLGVHIKREDGFHLDLDDFLMGLLQLASELSRWAVNAVTAGDYGRPLRISKFMAELDSGFRLLNLKNDSLRKRFDGLKYDLKKVEEVVYDVTIRGLKPNEETPTT